MIYRKLFFLSYLTTCDGNIFIMAWHGTTYDIHGLTSELDIALLPFVIPHVLQEHKGCLK